MTARNLDKWTTIAATVGTTAVACGMIYLGHYWIATVTAAVSVLGAMTIELEEI